MEPLRRWVLAAMADYAGEHGVAWASLASLATRANCSRDTARRAIRDALGAGWLERLAADDPRLPAEYRAWRLDRRPSAYRFTGLHHATPWAVDTVSTRSRRGSYGVAAGSHLGATQSLEQRTKNGAGSSDLTPCPALDGVPAGDPLERLHELRGLIRGGGISARSENRVLRGPDG